MWVPVAVRQPCELLYSIYLLTYLFTHLTERSTTITTQIGRAPCWKRNRFAPETATIMSQARNDVAGGCHEIFWPRNKLTPTGSDNLQMNSCYFSRHASLSKYYTRLEWRNINTNNTVWQSSNELSWISWESVTVIYKKTEILGFFSVTTLAWIKFRASCSCDDEQPDYSAIYLDHSTGNHYDCVQSLTSI